MPTVAIHTINVMATQNDPSQQEIEDEKLFCHPSRVCLRFGPAVVVSIAYMDPGNFATNIQAGAKYGYLSNNLRATIWDHELSESQLRERWRVQAQVLMTRMQISEVDALEILDAGRFSARNVNVVDE
ncbi:hypothetical protein [Paraburkholderia sediminicola]|uniref:hypothetical protein n=1 Tax=Paraburkholderia sediminicola TaxID=458836 RepID=UPI0038B7789E